MMGFFSRSFALVCGILCLQASHVWGLAMGPLSDFTDKDRVLVLAPHPDDEAIAVGGVIQKAIAAGASVRVVLLTSGENNELSFMVYKKRPVLRPSEILSMGKMRYAEAIAAVAFLGLSDKDVILLGYPDFGTMDIFKYHWAEARPLRAMLSRVRAVPYDNALSPGAPYLGDNILRDLKSVLYAFRPTKVFVSHPADSNRDHRALYLFLRVALWDVAKDIPSPEVYPYLVHITGWPLPRGYRPDLPLSAPVSLESSAVFWYYCGLGEDELRTKYTAIRRYVSQNKYAPSYLPTFARKNELFGDYPVLRVTESSQEIESWAYAGQVDGAGIPGRTVRSEDISGLAFARRNGELLVKMDLHRKVDKDVSLTLALLGYSPALEFSMMPKIFLHVSGGELTVRRGRQRLSGDEVFFVSQEKELHFRIPLSFLGNPDRILVSAKSSRHAMTLDETAWRVLEFK